MVPFIDWIYENPVFKEILQKSEKYLFLFLEKKNQDSVFFQENLPEGLIQIRTLRILIQIFLIITDLLTFIFGKIFLLSKYILTAWKAKRKKEEMDQFSTEISLGSEDEDAF